MINIKNYSSKWQSASMPTLTILRFLFGMAGLLVSVGVAADSADLLPSSGVMDGQSQAMLEGITVQAVMVLMSIGVFFAAFVYGLFVSLGSFEAKDKCHIFYALMAFTLIAAAMMQFGLVAVPDGLYWLPVFMLPVVNGFFTIYFLHLEKHLPVIHKLLVLNSLLSIVLLPLIIFIPGIALAAAIFCHGLWWVLALTAGVIRSFRGARCAVYYCCSLVCLFTAASLVMFVQFNSFGQFGPGNPFILLLGWAFYVVLSAFSLVDKFTTIAKRNILSSEGLEQLIQQRTTQLQRANQHLEKLAVDAQAASDAKNTFLVNMSHEIRTPLTAIIGYADGMLQGDIKANAAENAIRIISQNGVHLLRIINDLLDISKIEANELEIEKHSFDPLDLIQGICDSVEEPVQAKGLVLGTKFQLPLPTHMISDPTRFRQIIFNLINNAIKFTHLGAIELTVRADLDKFTVSVSDTGIGMSQDQINTMFNAFCQEDVSKSRQYGGIGLGLSIAKSLIAKLGGDISVTSAQGQGSMFTVDFDLEVPSEAKWLRDNTELDQRLADIKQNINKVQSIEVPVLSGNVLLAEDHLENQMLFIKLLERMGLNVTAVDNGYQAVQATLEQEFDLILLDIQMPEMDGIKAFELIQSTCADIPVIALTANAMAADVALYKKLGFNDHIAKPVNRENFINTVGSYLNMAKTSDISLGDDEMDGIKAQYVTRLVDRVGDLRQAQAQSDWEEIGKHAHAIKGSAGMFGFDQLGSLGGKLELAVQNADEPDCQCQLNQLLSLCDVITAKPGPPI